MGLSREEYNKEYYKYIHSPEWKKKALQQKNKVGECEVCRKTKQQLLKERSWLEVHHLTYDTWPNEDLDRDTAVLCHECHDEESTFERIRKEKGFKGQLKLSEGSHPIITYKKYPKIKQEPLAKTVFEVEHEKPPGINPFIILVLIILVLFLLFSSFPGRKQPAPEPSEPPPVTAADVIKHMEDCSPAQYYDLPGGFSYAPIYADLNFSQTDWSEVWVMGEKDVNEHKLCIIYLLCFCEPNYGCGHAYQTRNLFCYFEKGKMSPIQCELTKQWESPSKEYTLN